MVVYVEVSYPKLGMMLQQIYSKRGFDVNFLYKIEKKFGKYSINNLSLKIVICFAIGYFLWLAFPQVYEMLVFDYVYTFGGHQYWRIFTWIFTMPGEIGGFTILMLFIYASIGNSVERSVGTFLYNVYIFGTVISITIFQFVAGLVTYLQNAEMYNGLYDISKSYGVDVYGEEVLAAMSNLGPTYFLSISVFLGFALVFADAMMLFMFFLPIKATWVAYADLLVMAYYFIKYDDWVMRVIIIAVVGNFILFYNILKKYRAYRRFNATTAQIKRRKEFKQKVRQQEEKYSSQSNITRHKCAICGRSEKDGEELEFRFCSKCNGNYEYCNEHLFTHEHVK